MNKVLEIKHCNKSFGENEVLKDISLSVTEGQVVSIIGPSGSGKSTLLRCATMLETMDGGDLIYLGDYAAKADAQGKAVYAAKETLQGIKKHFGLVFQNFNLFPHYSVMKNITEPPILIGRRKKEEISFLNRKMQESEKFLKRRKGGRSFPTVFPSFFHNCLFLIFPGKASDPDCNPYTLLRFLPEYRPLPFRPVLPVPDLSALHCPF
jgi:ABC-type histidine transport system ATPase subunit